jgi:glycosyltransferase involved in cell wall biosynthesis
MKIAQIAPLIESVPPKKYGGTERVVSTLTEALVAKGHEVTLFASGDSKTAATLVSTTPKALRETYTKDFSSRVLYSHLHLGNAYERSDEFDIIHDHTGTFGAAFAQNCKTPTVLTLHGPITPATTDMFTQFTKPYLVTISNNQREPAPHLDYTATIYNGLDFKNYPIGHTRYDYLLFVGRICEEKGVHLAIEVAQKTHRPLIIAAKYEPEIAANKKYFTERIEPYLSSSIQFIGEVNEQQRNALMSRAYASLHPATWSEPFGLTLIEAMACGCPVIAFNRGSIPEIVKPGVSGYVVDTVKQMITAVEDTANITQTMCAWYARKYFSAEHMGQEYENLYTSILYRHAFPQAKESQLSPIRLETTLPSLHYWNN